MRLPAISMALAAAFVLAPAAAGHAPAAAQDFSITNPEVPADGSLRDVMRQLQAWWDVHGYYPRRAAAHDEGGTVKVHLKVQHDGNVWPVEVVGSSGSASLDEAGAAAFRKAFVRWLPDAAAGYDVTISLHYVLAHRHDQPVPPGYTPVSSKRDFSITNDPQTSPILQTMLQKTCTGTVTKNGIRNHPIYGIRTWAQAVFFRTPDGRPWVKFYEGGFGILAPVKEVGQMLMWTGRDESRGKSSLFTEYTVWPDGNNRFIGNLNINTAYAEVDENPNHGGTVDFTCETEQIPAPARAPGT